MKKIFIILLLLSSIIINSGCDQAEKCCEINPDINSKKTFISYNSKIYNCEMEFSSSKKFDIYLNDYDISFSIIDSNIKANLNNLERQSDNSIIIKNSFISEIYDVLCLCCDKSNYEAISETSFKLDCNNNKYTITTDSNGAVSGIESKNLIVTVN